MVPSLPLLLHSFILSSRTMVISPCLEYATHYLAFSIYFWGRKLKSIVSSQQNVFLTVLTIY